MEIELPVRFTGCREHQTEFVTLKLPVDRTALLLVDCNGDSMQIIILSFIQVLRRCCKLRVWLE